MLISIARLGRHIHVPASAASAAIFAVAAAARAAARHQGEVAVATP